jgi:nitroreductase
MAAPTAVDARPWDFIVITDKAVLKRLSDALPYAKMAVNAGSAIMVTGDLDRQFGGKDSLFWIMDCSAASENILLAAESMGLGAVWTAVYPDQGRVAAVRSILAIPDNVVPLNFIPVGVPSGQDKPKDKFDPKRVHKDRWSR